MLSQGQFTDTHDSGSDGSDGSDSVMPTTATKRFEPGLNLRCRTGLFFFFLRCFKCYPGFKNWIIVGIDEEKYEQKQNHTGINWCIIYVWCLMPPKTETE